MKNILLFGIAFMVMISLAGGASAFSLAPFFSYEMALHSDAEIDSSESREIAIMAFHEYSQNWELVFIAHATDAVPYDNLMVNINCNEGEEQAVINTTSYPDWVNEGRFAIYIPYYDDDYEIAYNEVELSAKYSKCDISVESYNGSFVNNSAYSMIGVEMIPMLSPIEFINCSDVESTTIYIANELEIFFTMVGDFWDMVWYIYSITIIIFTIFGLPIFLFMLLRWCLFRIAGVRLGGGE